MYFFLSVRENFFIYKIKNQSKNIKAGVYMVLTSISSSTISIDDPRAVTYFKDTFLTFLEEYYTNSYDELIFLCIGTDRSTGDSLGPLTGYKMEKNLAAFDKVHVYGTLSKPIHAKNLEETIEKIKKNHNKPFIIAIDACLGKVDRIGYITISPGPLRPGAGVNKELPPVGDIHITGIVNLGGFMEYIVLQNTRLGLVMNMAETIADSIYFALWKYQRKRRNLKEQLV